MKPTIELRNIEVAYEDTIVLQRSSLRLEGPGLVQILGPNGAGKTTLLRTMLGLVKPLSGKVLVNGVDVTGNPKAAGRHVGYVAQLERAPSHYPVTAWELVEYECMVRCSRWPRLRSPDPGRVERVLEAVGLPREAWKKRLYTLSGGQLQRVMIARALVHDPDILLMDEPLSAVDPAGKASLARLIGSLAQGKLVVVTSHDPMLLLEYTTTVVLVNKGIVAAGRPEETLTPENLAKVYGEAIVYVERHYHIADEHHKPLR